MKFEENDGKFEMSEGEVRDIVSAFISIIFAITVCFCIIQITSCQKRKYEIAATLQIEEPKK